jgi:hypothetical protein
MRQCKESQHESEVEEPFPLSQAAFERCSSPQTMAIIATL